MVVEKSKVVPNGRVNQTVGGEIKLLNELAAHSQVPTGVAPR